MIGVKPQVPYIDWNNPLTRGLVFDCPFFEGGGIIGSDIVNKTVGNFTNSPTWIRSQFGSAGKFVDGSSEIDLFVSKPIQNSLANMSVEALVFPTVNNANDKRFFHKGGDTKYFSMAYTNSVFEFSTSWLTVEGDWDTVTTYSPNKWYHVLTTYSFSNVSNTPSMYINGIPQTFNLVSTPSGATPTDTTDLGIGNRPVTKSKGWDGYISYVRYWNRIVTQGEARMLHENPWRIYRQPNFYQALNSISVAPATSFYGTSRLLMGVGI